MSALAERLDAAIRSCAPAGVFEAAGSSSVLERFRSAGFPTVALEAPKPGPAFVCPPQPIPLPQILILALPRTRLPTGEPDRTLLLAVSKFLGESALGEAFVLVIDPPYLGSTRRDVEPFLISSGSASRRSFALACASGIQDKTGRLVRWVVGSGDQSGAGLASRLLGTTGIDVVVASGFEVAEAAGSLRSSTRSVLAALANEWTKAFGKMGLDLVELLDLSGAREEFPSLVPNADSAPELFELNWALRRYDAANGLVERAGEVNASMPASIVSRLTDALNEASKPVRGSRILVAGIDGAAAGQQCPELEILRRLQQKRAIVHFHDPLRPNLASDDSGLAEDLASLPLTAEVLAAQDAVVIVRDRPGCDWGFVVVHSKLVVDASHATKDVRYGREKIVRA